MSIKIIPPILLKIYYRLFAFDLIRFALVGAVGFVVNYIMLALLFDLLKLPIALSQIIGAEVALLTTFAGNNFWAFHGHHHIPIKKKLLKYHLTAGTGIAISSTIVIGLVHFKDLYYGLALVIGAIAGLIWNYTLNRKVIFKQLEELKE